MSELAVQTNVEVPEQEMLAQKITDVVKFEAPEKDRIAEIKGTIDINNTVASIKFGVEAQKEITAFSDKVLEKVKVGESGDIGTAFQEMITTIKSSHLEEIKPDGFLKKLPIIGHLIKSSVEEFMGRSKVVTARINDTVIYLGTIDNKLTHEITVLDEMYKENLGLVRHLEIYIAAGEEFLTEVKEVDLAEKHKKAEESGDHLDVQNYKDLQQAIDRFERRIHNLKLARISAIQAAPQIRIVQDCHRMSVEDIQSIVHTNIPMWKRQFVLALSAFEGKKAIKVTKGIKDYTNDQNRKQAESIKELSESVAENLERGVLDIDTVVYVNDLTIETIENIVSSQREGRAKRMAAEELIRTSEKNMKDALMKSIEME